MSHALNLRIDLECSRALHRAQAAALVKDKTPEVPKDSGAKMEGDDDDNEVVVTRNDQLSMKSKNKGARKAKMGKNKKKKGTRKAKRSPKKAPTPTKAPVSRKRKMLKAMAVEDESMNKGGKKTKASSSGKKRDEEPMEPASKRNEKQAPAASSTAAPKPKAKGKARAKGEAVAKAKASPKAKTKASPKGKAKAKAKGRPKTGGKADFEERHRQSHLFDSDLLASYEKFAKSFDATMEVKSPQFKEQARAELGEYTGYRLNIYWTRCSVGVTDLSSGKDVVNFTFNTSSACDVHKLAVALKCGMDTVS